MLRDRAHLIGSLALAAALAASSAEAQTVAFVAPGESPPGEARRAVLRCFELLEPVEGVEVLESVELRRALAGLPAPEGVDDPLDDVRRFAARAQGDQRRPSLSRLGERLGVDLLVTVRVVGSELELRAFDVTRSAFYRGTLMIPALSPPDAAEVTDFVRPRVAAAAGASSTQAPAEPEPPRRRRRGGRWWVWVIAGGAAAAAVLVAVLATPREVEDTGVTVRIVAP